MSDLETTSLDLVLNQISEQSESNFVEVTDLEIIELEPQRLLLLATLREAASFTSSTERTRTLGITTVDEGINWRKTLDASQGSVNLDESFLLSDEISGNIECLWLITQWQIEATFPTLYWTTDAGETWQSSGAIQEFFVSKGHSTFNFAEGLRFRNTVEGIVIARTPSTNSREDIIYFLQTDDSGRTWEEISSIPSWYFGLKDTVSQFKWKERNFQIRSEREQLSIEKVIHRFSSILKSR